MGTHRQEQHAVHAKGGVARVEGQPGRKDSHSGHGDPEAEPQAPWGAGSHRGVQLETQANRAREVAQQLRALTASAEDPSSVPGSHILLFTTPYNS